METNLALLEQKNNYLKSHNLDLESNLKNYTEKTDVKL